MKAPHRGEDRAERRGLIDEDGAVGPTLDARDHVDRHLVQVLEEVPGRRHDASCVPRAVIGALTQTGRSRPLVLCVVDRTPEHVGDRGPSVGVGHDHEVPPLVVATGRRLERELDALADQERVDRPFEIETPTDGTCRREDVVDVAGTAQLLPAVRSAQGVCSLWTSKVVATGGPGRASSTAGKRRNQRLVAEPSP